MKNIINSLNIKEKESKYFHIVQILVVTPRRVRTLKRLRLLPRTPSSITYAEIGVQVVLQPEPDPQEIVEGLRDLLKEVMGMTTKNFDEVQRQSCKVSRK